MVDHVAHDRSENAPPFHAAEEVDSQDCGPFSLRSAGKNVKLGNRHPHVDDHSQSQEKNCDSLPGGYEIEQKDDRAGEQEDDQNNRNGAEPVGKVSSDGADPKPGGIDDCKEGAGRLFAVSYFVHQEKGDEGHDGE